MARSSSFFTLRSGSTKSLTFQTLRGKQITKDRVSEVANPQTDSQMLQRYKVPMVAQARAQLKGLVDHSFEGTEYGYQSLAKFSSLNLAKDALDIKAYVPKGAMDSGEANFIVSRGSLPSVSVYPGYYNGADSPSTEHPYGNVIFDPLNTDYVLQTSAQNLTGEDAEKLFVNAMLGEEKTSQLSFLAQLPIATYEFTSNGNIITALRHGYTLDRIDNAHTLSELGISLVVVNPTTETDGTITATFPDGAKIEVSYGSVQDTADTSKWNHALHDVYTAGSPEGGDHFAQYTAAFYAPLTYNFAGYCSYIAIIRSYKKDTTWARSSQRLQPVNPTIITSAQVAPTYVKNATDSLKFLNNGSDATYITGNGGTTVITKGEEKTQG